MSASDFRLPTNELTWLFSRSSGPGGQHVNTSDTRVELRWPLDSTAVLNEAQREQVAARLGTRLIDGELRIVSSRFRSQTRNRDDARQRLETLVIDALRPRKRRRMTRPGPGAAERRLEAKRRRSQLKQQRRADW
jgi:ribosome-associated protein